jgi:hypothetical protein
MAQALVNEEVKTIAQKVSLRIFNEIGEDKIFFCKTNFRIKVVMILIILAKFANLQK